MSAWIKLNHVLKTEQVYQAINLLAEYHICLRTRPDEFNGKGGSARLLSMDPNILWPLFVKRKHMKQALTILASEHLYYIPSNAHKQ